MKIEFLIRKRVIFTTREFPIYFQMAARARLTKPKLPAFDRGAKPQQRHVHEEIIVRNFSGQGQHMVSLKCSQSKTTSSHLTILYYQAIVVVTTEPMYNKSSIVFSLYRFMHCTSFSSTQNGLKKIQNHNKVL